MASTIPLHYCSMLQRVPGAGPECRRSSQRSAAPLAAGRAAVAQRRPPAAAALARRSRLAPVRALTRPEDELDSDEDEEWELEAEEDLDESDFMDLEGVTISVEEQGPKYWNDYQTRFLSTELTTMADATRPRLAQRQAAAGMGAAAALRQQLPSVGDMLAAAGTAEAAAATAAAQQRPAHGPPDAAALLQGAPVDTEQPAAEAPAEPERERVWAELWNPPPEPRSEWDLRAMAEKQQRKQREQRAWLAARAAVGRRQGQWSDWRTDVRIDGTGDPTQPQYREWTHREIWDLITQGGRAADPRHVLHRVASPTERADFVEQGARYHPETEDWIASLGRLIPEDGEGGIVDDAAEAALLDDEFEGFDDRLGVQPSEDYEGDTYEDDTETSADADF